MTTHHNPKHILVALAWPYANGEPHVGHIAGVNIPADIFARYHRMAGHHVAMVSGSDMHGTPTMLRALDEGVEPREVAERYHEIWDECLKRMGISYDLYTRTNTDNHAAVTQEIFLRLLDRDYIYEKAEELPFSESEQIFLPDRMVEGTCPHCSHKAARGDQCDGCGRTLDPQELLDIRSKRDGTTPVFKETKHFFLRLSAFAEPLREWMGEGGKADKWRANAYKQTLAIIDTIQDRAITRDLTWGVPLPDDPRIVGYENKRIYVWFEAVLGYLSATKQWAEEVAKDPGLLGKYWDNPKAEAYYFMGKDNVPFHSVILPAMLIGSKEDNPPAGRKLPNALNKPTEVVASEFLNLKSKLSKSSGNAVWLREYLKEYEPEPLRYYLTSIMPEKSDAEFSWEGFLAANNNELVATYGNFVNRTMKMAHSYFDGQLLGIAVSDGRNNKVEALVQPALDNVAASIEGKKFKDALKIAMGLAQEGNRYLEESAPWQTIKEGPNAAALAIEASLRVVEGLKIAFYPFLPEASQKIHRMLGLEGAVEDQGWRVLDMRADVIEGRKLGEPEILFRKLEPEIVQRENDKLGLG